VQLTLTNRLHLLPAFASRNNTSSAFPTACWVDEHLTARCLWPHGGVRTDNRPCATRTGLRMEPHVSDQTNTSADR
jgi:hypothetical protein